MRYQPPPLFHRLWRKGLLLFYLFPSTEVKTEPTSTAFYTDTTDARLSHESNTEKRHIRFQDGAGFQEDVSALHHTSS